MCTLARIPDATWASYTDSTDPHRGIKCVGVDQRVIYRAWKLFRWGSRVAAWLAEL